MEILPPAALKYLKGLMCVFENANCVSLSKVSCCSHDCLARVLNQSKLSWQILLQSLVLRTFGKLQRGYLIIDDTVINKQFAKRIENISWIFDSQIGKSVLGLNIVMLAWSNGSLTIPLALEIYRKDSGKTKIDLAIKLLKYARNLGLKPDYVTFDAWYSAEQIFKKIAGFGWIFITRIKKNRKLNGTPVKKFKPNPYWLEKGKLSGGLEVLVVRHGSKYFATNNLSLTKKEILDFYRGRWLVETIFRVLHFKIGIDQCQSLSLKAQNIHFHLCLLAYLFLEKERLLSQTTIYQVKQRCSFNFKEADSIVSKLIFQGA